VKIGTGERAPPETDPLGPAMAAGGGGGRRRRRRRSTYGHRRGVPV